MNELPHHTAECWTRIGFWTVCDVTSHARSPASLNQILNERRENTHFEQWGWKQPPRAKLCTYVTLHSGTQTFKRRNMILTWRGTLRPTVTHQLLLFFKAHGPADRTAVPNFTYNVLNFFFGLIPRLWSCWTSCQVVLSCHVLHASILFVSALVCPLETLGQTWCCFFLFL